MTRRATFTMRTCKRAKINTARRQANRALNTDKLLALLRSETPNFFELAEIIGKWVWIQFADKQPSQVTRVSAELGRAGPRPDKPSQPGEWP